MSGMQPAAASDVRFSPNFDLSASLTDVERLFLQSIDALVGGDLRGAEQQLRRLLETQPDFSLARVILADTLAMQSGRASKPQSLEDPALVDVLQELRYRASALASIPPANAWPLELVALARNQHDVIVVDVESHRLYWLQRDDSQNDRLKLVRNFYISIGKAGYGKQREGDNKTPIGSYRIVALKDASELPSFYGAGALILDYPNSVDRQLMRSGSGIWIHGTPPNTYSRPPLASEGCIVVANDDMLALLQHDGIQNVPVLLMSGVQWRTESGSDALAPEFERLYAWLHQRLAELPARDQVTATRWQESDGSIYWRLEWAGQDGHSTPRTLFVRERDNEFSPVQPEPWFLTSLDRQQSPSAQASSPSHSAGGDESDIEAVRQHLLSWARAWSQRDIENYFSHYHPAFAPSGKTHDQWRRSRLQRIESRAAIDVQIERLRIVVDSDRAYVTFIQRYRAAGAKELRTHKSMELQRMKDRWWIVAERAGQ
ncbi:L,D-transpeptidase catalytic domain [Tepidimonas charontis]|uniref:L,D-transpeptidase catalytic domain n=2 Tax=Tepidimonas charontis TaxID=2267262 RepID=A0A554XJ74_9BURK|nr:L,D-transpeptidase catalytic domain [Tepidimonas charontis]